MKKQTILFSAIIFFLLFAGCVQETNNEPITMPSRESKIPQSAVKMTPETDVYPPILHSSEYQTLVPLPGPVNTAGAEDSPFIPYSGNSLYFFFTPDVTIPVEKQILDNVTGLYVSQYQNGTWNSPERLMLQEAGKLALDGCECIDQNILWFCSAREGYIGVHWFTAEYMNGQWKNWQNADFNPDYEVGELHFYGDTLYFHSARSGGQGGLDIWMSTKVNDIWQEPTNIAVINTESDEGWPYITDDGSELWFTRTYQGSPAIYRSKKINTTWQTPELIVSQFAGEPTLDFQGNIYFVHHYYNNSIMIEADIYIAYKI